MRIEMTTPALLFTAISLLISAYTSRFLTLAGLLRQLDLQYKKDKDEIVLMQIKNLRMLLMKDHQQDHQVHPLN